MRVLLHSWVKSDSAQRCHSPPTATSSPWWKRCNNFSGPKPSTIGGWAGRIDRKICWRSSLSACTRSRTARRGPDKSQPPPSSHFCLWRASASDRETQRIEHEKIINVFCWLTWGKTRHIVYAYRWAHDIRTCGEVMYLFKKLFHVYLLILSAPCIPAFGKVVSLCCYSPPPAVEPRRIPIPRKFRSRSERS